MIEESKAFALALSFGALGGGCAAAMLYYWLWNMRPSKFETELIRSDIKDIRNDLHVVAGRCRALEDRMDAIEKPPFEPKFGDWVSTTYRGAAVRAVYLAKLRDGQHRVIANVGSGTTEFYADEVEPLND